MTIDRKVRYGALSTAVSGILASLFVVVFHRHLSPELVALLPVLVASVIGWATAWLTKHDPKLLALLELAECTLELQEAEKQRDLARARVPAVVVVPPKSATGGCCGGKDAANG
jgi:hypothetical protein